jgi:hypothetical protein
MRVEDPSGEPETFPGPGDLEAKFATLAGPVLNTGTAVALSKLNTLPSAPDVRGWFA